MRLLADENIPERTAAALRKLRYDVEEVRVIAPGASDEGVFRMATEAKRVIITFDKDFSSAIFRRDAGYCPGVVLLRFRITSPDSVAQILHEALTQKLPWEGSLSVISENQIRQISFLNKS